jgi:hypothetical protein
MAVSDRLGGRAPIRVYMLDNSFKTLLLDSSWTAEVVACHLCLRPFLTVCGSKLQRVCQAVADKLGFVNPSNDLACFALYGSQDGIVGELRTTLFVANQTT